MHWFNHERTHESIDDLTPIEVENTYYAARNGLPADRVKTPTKVSGNSGSLGTCLADLDSAG